MLVLALGVAGGALHAGRVSAERLHAQQAERQRWLDQGDVNPHAAAHYGTFVFAPSEALGLIDPGIRPFVGAAVFLEAHQQQLSRYRPVDDAGSVRRLSAPSIATGLQVLLPLLLVLFAAGAITRERERGTWKLLLAAGVPPRTAAAGKLAGVALALGFVTGPAFGLALIALSMTPGVSIDGDTVMRAVALTAAYAAYLMVWLFAGLAVSALAASTRGAVGLGLAMWLAGSVIAPPALLAVATASAPAPTAAAMTAAIDEERARRPTWDQRVEAATGRFLRGEDLPAASNPEVVALIDTEAADTEIYTRYLDALGRIFARQSHIYQTLSLLSPAVAIQSLSMALAATDDEHYRHFLAGASRYRTALLSSLNDELAAFDSWKTFTAAGSRELWARVPEFEYDTPAIGWAVRRQVWSLISMALWLLATAVLLWRTAGRTELPR